MKIVWVPSEAPDELVVWLPKLEVLHSAEVLQGESFPNLHTIRGTRYRDPERWFTGIDVMRHFPDDESTELTRPQMLLLAPGKPPWRVRSETGWISSGGALILLQGEVHIEREAGEGVRPLHLVTRDLRVQPKDEYAETDQPVRVESGANRVESIGLQAWLREPVRIKLLADVRGYYEANP